MTLLVDAFQYRHCPVRFIPVPGHQKDAKDKGGDDEGEETRGTMELSGLMARCVKEGKAGKELGSAVFKRKITTVEVREMMKCLNMKDAHFESERIRE